MKVDIEWMTSSGSLKLGGASNKEDERQKSGSPRSVANIANSASNYPLATPGKSLKPLIW